MPDNAVNAFTAYAAELALIAGDPDPLPALLSRHDARPWRRTYARFHPNEPSYCTLLYETGAAAFPLRVSLYRDSAAAPGGEAVAGLGVVHVASPIADEALDTLEAVLARHVDAAIVRYRPGHRCTFRAMHAQTGSQYVKVFASGTIAPHLTAGMHSLWQRRDELGFHVAQPLDFDCDLRFASQAALPGTPLFGELLGPHGLEVAAAIGRAAATLPQSSVAATTAAEDDDTLSRTGWYTRSIAELLPEYAERMHSLASRLDRLEAACAPARRLPIHGGLHALQWLRCGHGGPPLRRLQSERGGMPLGLVDFDRLGLGDPELDVATFVTELRYEGSATVPAAQLCRAFTDAYAEHVPLDARRVELYVAHKEAAKLMRLARQPRPDAPRRFARALEQFELAAERRRGA